MNVYLWFNLNLDNEDEFESNVIVCTGNTLDEAVNAYVADDEDYSLSEDEKNRLRSDLLSSEYLMLDQPYGITLYTRERCYRETS
jgi:hypothetical protein